jgi:hypothetical protein
MRGLKLGVLSILALAVSAILTLVPPTAHGAHIFVTNNTAGKIGEYSTSGATVNAALVSGSGPDNPTRIAPINLVHYGWGGGGCSLVPREGCNFPIPSVHTRFSGNNVCFSHEFDLYWQQQWPV